jgi:hypothetical protein
LSEQHLVDQLADMLLPGTLNLADRNFFSMARWVRFTATGAHLAWRVKNGAKSVPARIMRVLPDGSATVRLRESDAMLTARRAKDRMDITGARWGLPGAEAVLKLRALISNADFDDYWPWHLAQEQQRTHNARYLNGVIPAR